IMLGFVGGDQWRGFAASPEYRDGRAHPLDRWSHRVISALARDLRAKPYFPFTAPLMPFIRWAQKAEAVHPSEIGMLIHPDFGLWHAWRGALAFKERFELPPREERPRPCDSCTENLASPPVRSAR
ncbi:MAG: ferredoxin, partial [Rhodospirillales bacterium]|nr:ferredoxin [Rhodospirillales bacterium]